MSIPVISSLDFDTTPSLQALLEMNETIKDLVPPNISALHSSIITLQMINSAGFATLNKSIIQLASPTGFDIAELVVSVVALIAALAGMGKAGAALAGMGMVTAIGTTATALSAALAPFVVPALITVAAIAGGYLIISNWDEMNENISHVSKSLPPQQLNSNNIPPPVPKGIQKNISPLPIMSPAYTPTHESKDIQENSASFPIMSPLSLSPVSTSIAGDSKNSWFKNNSISNPSTLAYMNLSPVSTSIVGDSKNSWFKNNSISNPSTLAYMNLSPVSTSIVGDSKNSWFKNNSISNSSTLAYMNLSPVSTSIAGDSKNSWFKNNSISNSSTLAYMNLSPVSTSIAPKSIDTMQQNLRETITPPPSINLSRFTNPTPQTYIAQASAPTSNSTTNVYNIENVNIDDGIISDLESLLNHIKYHSLNSSYIK